MVFNTVVGTGIFYSLTAETSASLIVAAGVLSILAALLATVHTFLDFSNRASRHRTTAAEYGSARRYIQSVLADPQLDNDGFRGVLQIAREKLDNISKVAPHIPTKWYESVPPQGGAREESTTNSPVGETLTTQEEPEKND